MLFICFEKNENHSRNCLNNYRSMIKSVSKLMKVSDAEIVMEDIDEIFQSPWIDKSFSIVLETVQNFPDLLPQAHGLALLTRVASPSDTCKLCTAVELGSLKLFVPGPD